MSERIYLTLNGGTKLRMPSERSPTAPYDLLLSAMKQIEVWDGDDQQWCHGWLMVAEVLDDKAVTVLNPIEISTCQTARDDL